MVVSRSLLHAVLVLALFAAVAVASPAVAQAETANLVAVVRGADGSLSVEHVVVGAAAADPVGAPATDGAQAALEALRARPDVVAADVDIPTRTLSSDPYLSQQWALTALDAPKTWTTSTGSGAVVAVLDSGVQGDHPDLRNAVLPGADFTGEGGDGRRDGKGHGTHVAGIIAAARGNGVGTAGFAYGARILPVQVLTSGGGGLLSWAAQGIIWATDHGADVINMSLGASSGNSVLDAAVAYAISRGVVLVAASGNDGAAKAYWPAAHRDVIAVGATTSSGSVASFSNRDATLDVVAPGASILSTCVTSRWCVMSGTSMATPHVSAAVAAIAAVRPDLSSRDMRTLLQRTAIDVTPKGHDPVSGYGRVNLVGALHSALTSPDPFLSATTGLQRVGASNNPRAVAVATSRHAFPGTAAIAVVARDDVFADSLTGAALAARRGPVLFTAGGADAPLAAETRAELMRVLDPGSPVYVLGGELAVSARAFTDITNLGFDARRLAGATRTETAARVADDVTAGASTVKRVLIARADHWADAVTGSAYAARSGSPILLTGSDRLDAAARTWLSRHDVEEAVLLGGTAALTPTVAKQVDELVGRVRRVGGVDRADTAALIARDLWLRSSGKAEDGFVVIEGYTANAWAPAVAAAVLSAMTDAPQLLVTVDRVPGPTASYLTALRYSSAKPGRATAVGTQVGAAAGYRLLPLIGR